jgi:hypothetical protein
LGADLVEEFVSAGDGEEGGEGVSAGEACPVPPRFAPSRPALSCARLPGGNGGAK